MNGTVENDKQYFRTFEELPYPADGNSGQGIRRILFVMASLPARPASGHLQAVMDYATSLARYTEVDMHVLLTNEDVWQGAAPVDRSHGCALRQRAAALGLDFEALEARVAFHYGESDPGPTTASLMARIERIDPDVLIFGGGVMGSRLLPAVAHAIYPTMFRQFSRGNRPDDDHDLYLSIRPSGDGLEGLIHPERWRFHRPVIIPAAVASDGPSTAFRKPAGQFVLVTVTGNMNNRLVDGRFLADVAALLRRRPGMIWLLVGVQAPEELLSRDAGLSDLARSGRVRTISYENDLRGLYTQCDIFLNHKYTGGSRSMALAAHLGMPVVVFRGSDACNFLDTGVVFDTHEEYMAFVERLVDDPVLRASVGRRLKALVDDRAGPAFAQELLNQCAEARRLGRRRLAVVNAPTSSPAVP